MTIREKILMTLCAVLLIVAVSDNAVAAYFHERFMKVRHFVSVGLATYPAQFAVQSESTTTVTGIFRGIASQSVDILQVQNFAETELFDVDGSGNVTMAGTLAPSGAMTVGGKLTVNDIALIDNDAVSDSNITLTVQGGTSQTGNLLTLENSGGTDMFTVGITGNTQVAGTFGATGNSTLSGTLAVTSTSTFSGKPTVNDIMLIDNDAVSDANDTLTVQGGTSQTGDLATFEISDGTDKCVIDINGQVTAQAGVTPASKTSDPCTGAGFAAGSVFYNSTNGIMCYCDGNSVDLKIDGTSASCF